ncbi:hypothetical protein HYW17_01730 [Candidatus Uhrbacteria bacterium]|nr:hypothetical protein [Candidatus Uhrbacteria bacterium]
MRKIVLSAVVAIVVTVGTYHIARVMGVSEHLASMVAVATTFAFATILATVMVATTAAFATVASMVAFIVATAVNIAFVNDALDNTGFAVIAFFTAFVAVIYTAGAAEDQVATPATIGAYILEAVAIGIALTRADKGWSIGIALGGIVVLFIFEYLVRKLGGEVVSTSPTSP